MICDKDGGGTMSEDECMEVIAESLFLMSCMRGKECTEVSLICCCPQILYHRFGKDVMTELVNKLFKHSQDEGEKEFTFTEFLHLVDPNTGILAAHMRAQKEQSSGGRRGYVVS
jgi:hypothetical protein